MNTENQQALTTDNKSAPPWCCALGCPNKATKLVYNPNGHYEDYTHSCDNHIEELKSTGEDIVEDIDC